MASARQRYGSEIARSMGEIGTGMFKGVSETHEIKKQDAALRSQAAELSTLSKEVSNIIASDPGPIGRKAQAGMETGQFTIKPVPSTKASVEEMKQYVTDTNSGLTTLVSNLAGSNQLSMDTLNKLSQTFAKHGVPIDLTKPIAEQQKVERQSAIGKAIDRPILRAQERVVGATDAGEIAPITKENMPSPDMAKYYGRPVTELTGGRPESIPELIQAGMRSGAPEADVIAHPRYQVEARRMAAPTFEREGQTSLGAYGETLRAGQDPSEYEEGFNLLSQQEKLAAMREKADADRAIKAALAQTDDALGWARLQETINQRAISASSTARVLQENMNEALANLQSLRANGFVTDYYYNEFGQRVGNKRYVENAAAEERNLEIQRQRLQKLIGNIEGLSGRATGAPPQQPRYDVPEWQPSPSPSAPPPRTLSPVAQPAPVAQQTKVVNGVTYVKQSDGLWHKQ